MSNVEIEFRLDQPVRRPREEAGPQKDAPPRIPRIARLLALAIKVQDMVDRGEMRDYAEVARLGHVTRARMTQIMNLLNLAPEIQEELLFSVADLPTEHAIRRLAACCRWPEQVRLWRNLVDQRRSGTSAIIGTARKGQSV
jgi:hypothetical protein